MLSGSNALGWRPATAPAIAVAVMVMAAMVGPGGVAHAAMRPVTGDVLLGFGETYAGSGGHRTHHGADLGAAAGEEVRSPIGGLVVFSGTVPAPGGGVTRIRCVTVEAGVDRWSLLPLGDAHVEAGATVVEGQILGTVAGGGDPSSQASHLHVGLRREGAYQDPVPLLAETPVLGAPAQDAPRREPPSAEGPTAARPGEAGVRAARGPVVAEGSRAGRPSPRHGPAPTADPVPLAAEPAARSAGVVRSAEDGTHSFAMGAPTVRVGASRVGRYTTGRGEPGPAGARLAWWMADGPSAPEHTRRSAFWVAMAGMVGLSVACARLKVRTRPWGGPTGLAPVRAGPD